VSTKDATKRGRRPRKFLSRLGGRRVEWFESAGAEERKELTRKLPLNCGLERSGFTFGENRV